MEKLKLVIADDHHILLDGLKALLQKQKDMEVAGFYDNGQSLYDALAGLPDVSIALVDINMPILNGHQLTLMIKENYPNISVIVLSMHDDADHISEMLEAGISGYLLKNSNDKDLLDAIRTVANGRMFFSPEVSEKIAEMMKQQQKKRDAPETPKLTEREVEIMKLIAKEYSNSQIADTLFISERTVETHRKNMMRKTGNKTIIGLMKYAIAEGIL